MITCNNDKCKFYDSGKCKRTSVSIVDDSCVSYRRQINTDWSKLMKFNKSVFLEGETNG